ncbi:MAG: J domain-containing protein [Coleofasciculaceae cyanobacterium SM2_3_26]|nr:J domain-containing protein [Coleofasciculaceae cyanobacterium SM2_3_26]
MLGIPSIASANRVRQAYRELSKRYHPDTTDLPEDIARAKFQQLREAYATLSNPDRRLSYDRRLRYARWQATEAAQMVPVTSPAPPENDRLDTDLLDPNDRPLSAAELFSLFILGLALVGCLMLAIAVGLSRGGAALKPILPPSDTVSDLGRSPYPLAASSLLPGFLPQLPLATPDRIS